MALSHTNIRFTASGMEVPAVTAEQMREVDRIAMQETGPNLFQMMENAGRNLASVALDILGERGTHSRILVLAGTGGNGGGGICAARHLANHGVNITLCLADPHGLSEVANWQYQIFRATPGKTLSAADLAGASFDLIVDALIGYSLTGAPRGVFADLIGWANAARAKILALDVPSGLDSTTGATPGAAIAAQTTLTLALPKTGLKAVAAGRLLLGDIGIPLETYRRLHLSYAPPFGSHYVVPLNVRNGEPT
jgi:NAD(P)H-hydrate epimerase